jgi:Transketolase, thiamine diphosphate binding domain
MARPISRIRRQPMANRWAMRKSASSAYGWPEDAKFLVPDGVREHFAAGIGSRGAEARGRCEALFASYRARFPELATEINQMQRRELPAGWDRNLPSFSGRCEGDRGTRETRECSGQEHSAPRPKRLIAVAVLAFIGWAVWGPAPAFAYGLIAAVSVLIIACPCALGLATPVHGEGRHVGRRQDRHAHGRQAPRGRGGAVVFSRSALNCNPCVRSVSQTPTAWMYSPAEIDAACPTSGTKSRLPRAFTLRTAKPVSALWKVTRSTLPTSVSRSGPRPLSGSP